MAGLGEALASPKLLSLFSSFLKSFSPLVAEVLEVYQLIESLSETSDLTVFREKAKAIAAFLGIIPFSAIPSEILSKYGTINSEIVLQNGIIVPETVALKIKDFLAR